MRGALRVLFRLIVTAVPPLVTVACSESSPSLAPPSEDAGADARVTDRATADAGAADAGAQDARAADAGVTETSRKTAATLELPWVPQASTKLSAVPSFPAPGDRSVLSAESPLFFALADGYPTELTGRFVSHYFSAFGLLHGELSFERLELPASATGFVSAQLVEGGVHVAVSREGDATLVAHGTYVPTAEERSVEPLTGLSSVPFAMRIPVHARRVVGTRFVLPSGCTEPLYVATSSVLESLSVGLVDTDGELLYPSNTQFTRAVSTTIEADTPFAWKALDDDEGLETLRFPDVATRVTVRPAMGEPLLIQVVDAAQITKANVSFALAGLAGLSLELRDGMSYAGSFHRASNRIAPIVTEVHAGSTPLCSLPDPAWFSLISDTPAQCDIRPLTTVSIDSLVLPNSDIGLTAFVRADGACSLRLRAQGFEGGVGFERRLKIALTNVAEMTQVE